MTGVASTTHDKQSVPPSPSGLALIRLLRPTNAIPAALLVLLAPHLLDLQTLPAPVWRAAAAMATITAYGYVSNDNTDIAEDAVNKPDRPLPSGAISVRQARILASALALFGLAAAATISSLALLTAAAVLGLLHLYNVRLKATPGIGNLLIGLLAGGALITGGVAARGIDLASLVRLLPPALTLAIFISAREILKTVQDMPGDRSVGKETLALRYGLPTVVRIGALLAGSLALSIAISVSWLGYSMAYLVIACTGVLLPLSAAVIDLVYHPFPGRAQAWLVLLKGSYIAGLLALAVA